MCATYSQKVYKVTRYVYLVFHISGLLFSTCSIQGVYALGVAWDLAVSGLIPWVWGPPPLSPAPGGAQNNKKELCM